MVSGNPSEFDVCVVGGCGHVGLPLALTFAAEGLRVAIYDIDAGAVAKVQRGDMPFREPGAEALLRDVVGKTLTVSTDVGVVSRSRFVVVIIGTPVDEHLNPTFHKMRRFFLDLMPSLVDGQCVILRSTILPGTTEKIAALLGESGRRIHVAFCPERVAQGKALEELRELPQIIAAFDDESFDLAEGLFRKIARSTLRLTPLEAELTKIFANVWRYIQFATANQFFMIATQYGTDFYTIYDALTRDYPRMAGLPKSGFAAGPCLFKDTMQLATANHNNFSLGHAAMLINEGLPNFIISQLKQVYPLSEMRVGILGMTFKADCDDPRESLCYKLRKLLECESREVLCTDVYVHDSSFQPVGEVLSRADLIILGTPHREYAALPIPEGTPVWDIWNFFGNGAEMPHPAAGSAVSRSLRSA
jgi:UDP-N-acetyl-D-mannosaminuronic acid dehydrogenase